MITIHNRTRFLLGYVLVSAFVTFATAAPGEVNSFSKITDGLNGLPVGTLTDYFNFGSSCTTLGDLDGDGIPELVVGAEGADSGSSLFYGRGAVYILFLNANGTVRNHTKIGHNTGGFGALLEEDDDFGSSCATLGDLDGDGIPEIAVGAMGDNSARGAVYVLFLEADGSVNRSTKIADGLGGLPGGTLANLDDFGSSCTTLGDLDGDGIPELGVGANRDDTGGSNRGAVYVLFLNADGTVRNQTKIADNIGGLGTLANGSRFGSSCTTLGDLDGDGIPEIAVGATGDNSARGAVYVLFLEADGSVNRSTKIADGLGGLPGGTLANLDDFGSSCTTLGDLDGDGIPELGVGAMRDDTGGSDRGAVYVLFLNADGTVRNQTKIADNIGGFGTLAYRSRFGISCTTLGDLDGDGAPELAVGADGDETGDYDEFGALYILSLGDLPLKVTTQLDELNTPSSAGDGVSLREAIRDVKATGEFREIRFDASLNGETIRLGSELFLDNIQVRISGKGLPDGITISGEGSSRVFNVTNSTTVMLECLTIANGLAPSGAGIGMNTINNTVVLLDSTIRDCNASSDGGAIQNSGILRVERSSFVNNHADGSGGAVSNAGDGTDSRYLNTTFSGNVGTGNGGAVFEFRADSAIYSHCTFLGNSAPGGAGGGIFALLCTVNVTNSLFGSLSDDTANSGGDFVFDSVATIDPGEFAPLARYGGKTPTLPLLAGSSAIDGGTFFPLPNTDQLGKARLVGSLPDLGAVEFVPPPPVAPPALVNNFAQIVKLKKKLRKFKKKQKNARRKGQAAKNKKFKKKIKKLKKQLRAL